MKWILVFGLALPALAAEPPLDSSLHRIPAAAGMRNPLRDARQAPGK